MGPASPEVVVLCWNAPSVQERRAQQIAAFLGVAARFQSIAPSAADDLRSPGAPPAACLIADAETLAKAVDAAPSGRPALREFTTGIAKQVFVFGFNATDRHNEVLRELSSGDLVGVRTLGVQNRPFRISEARRDWCRQFSGLTVGAAASSWDRTFDEGPATDRSEALIRAAQAPFFVRTTQGDAQVCMVACSELADLDEEVGRNDRTLTWFSRLAPLMMFLHAVMGNRVWHNDHPRACVIIDDPLLKRRYGFLEFASLADSIRRNGFSTCIAFIPWNYRRSDKRVAALFASANGRLGLCVHGCNHTRAEFASTEVGTLRGKATLAYERMQAHHRLSGVGFADVMVFPQGLFSDAALAALKESGYLAAVNSDVCPSGPSDRLALRDAFDVAVTRFADFPLFGRRYPRDLAQIAFDLFVGKPALAVEHHGYFRDGLGPLEAFVRQVKGLDPRIVWSDVATACASACKTRTAADGTVHVRFYTSRFRLTNTGSRSVTYVLQLRHSAASAPRVMVDGVEHRHALDAGIISLRLTLSPGAAADVRVASPIAAASPSPTAQPRAAGIWLRRRLSEFRDNHVDTNPVLTALLSRARQALAGAPSGVPAVAARYDNASAGRERASESRSPLVRTL